jgi:hypothetical protein
MNRDTYQLWQEDQELFSRPPLPLGDRPLEARPFGDSTAGLTRTLPPPAPRSSLRQEVLWLSGAAVLGLGLSVGALFWLREPSAPAASSAVVSEPVPSRAVLAAVKRTSATTSLQAKPSTTPRAEPIAHEPEAERTPKRSIAAAPVYAPAPEAEVDPDEHEDEAPIAAAHEEEEEPVAREEQPEEPEAPPAPPFDKSAAVAAMSGAAAQAAGCGAKKGPFGPGGVTITVAPSGKVTSVSVDAPYAGTVTGQCIARQFQSVSIPAFSGEALTLRKSFVIKDPNPPAEDAAPVETAPKKDSPKEPADAPRPKKRNTKGRVDLS